MLIDSNEIVSMADANRNFSQVAKSAEEGGCVVIFKNNKPKFVLMDIEKCRLDLPTSNERIEKTAKRRLSQAKWL